MPTTLPGGLWYPERNDLHRPVFGAPDVVAVSPGDAIGNRFAFDFAVRCEGVGVRVRLWDALRVEMLDPADTVLGTRDWAAVWTYEWGSATRTQTVLVMEWPAPIELAASTEYRVLVTATGAVAIDAYAPLIDDAYPGTGTLIRRVGGVWTDDDTRRCETTLRLTGL